MHNLSETNYRSDSGPLYALLIVGIFVVAVISAVALLLS